MGKALTFIAIALCVVVFSPPHCVAQQPLVETGPFGAPIRVADESGNFSHAIVVYETKDVGYVIPDITSRGWRQWYIPEFRKSGTYPIQLYIWYKTTKTCESAFHRTAQECAELGFVAETIQVNTRTHTIHEIKGVMVDRDGIPDMASLQVQNHDESLRGQMGVAIDRITKIVERESAGSGGSQ